MNEEAKAARREYYRAYYRTHKQELQKHKERYWEKYVQRAKQTKTTKDGDRTHCPYCGASLKEEPNRLLSIEEIKDSDDKIIWIEMAYIDGRKIPYLRKGLLYTVRDYGVIEILSESVKVGGYIADIIRLDTRLNNLTWRCWLRKPTDEEREAMLWEEESNNAD